MMAIKKTRKSIRIQFSIHKTILYREYILEVLKACGHTNEESILYFKKQMILDIKGMAKTWLKGPFGISRNTDSYTSTYFIAKKINQQSRYKSP